ncbi:MAG: hypothetical protein KAW16_01915 [candidate division Zixibacteria bacterium]|nr:hypothetical protein [candidate division Zixibacteria bacterium]
MDERKIRFGFLVFILDQLGENRYYGLIVAQKVVYFLKEAFGVGLPYNFYFYHFGPYSDALDWDLQMMKSFSLIDIGADPARTGYSIEVNDKVAKESIREAQEFIKTNKPKIDKVLELFGDYTPSGLELASTIHFVYKNNKSKQPKAQLRRIVVEKVKRLKPKFTVSQIKEQYDYLTEKNIIT